MHFIIKSLNRAENRRRKRNRSKVLGFGASGPVLERSGAVFIPFKKAPRAYGTLWELTAPLMQGGGLGPARERKLRNFGPQSLEIVVQSVVDTKCLLLGAPEPFWRL